MEIPVMIGQEHFYKSSLLNHKLASAYPNQKNQVLMQPGEFQRFITHSCLWDMGSPNFEKCHIKLPENIRFINK